MILEELRADTRDAGRKLPRLGNAQRLFFAPIEPFLVDDTPERKHRGRISRACLTPIWEWIARDLMPQEAKTYVDQVNLLLAANGRKDAAEVARAFQDLAEQRMREVQATSKSDVKAARRVAAQIGTPQALEDVREIGAILRVRDALGVIASRLPASISNLADEQLENVKTLLESPIGRHRDVFLYALLLVMSRLGSPWQLIRLAIQAAGSDAAARIAETPFAVAVEIVLADVARMIARLRDSVKAGRGAEVATHLKDVHDAVRGLRTELDFSSDSGWARQLAAFRSEVSKLLQAEIENLPGQVRRVLRPRPAKETGPNATLDAGDVDEIEAQARARRGLPQLCGRTRVQRGDPARPLRSAELFRQRHAGPDRPAAHLAAGRAQLPPVAGRCRGEVLRQAVRRGLRQHARQGRRRGRERRAEGREGVRRPATSPRPLHVAERKRAIRETACAGSPLCAGTSGTGQGENGYAATLIVPALLSTITGECRYSIDGRRAVFAFDEGAPFGGVDAIGVGARGPYIDAAGAVAVLAHEVVLAQEAGNAPVLRRRSLERLGDLRERGRLRQVEGDDRDDHGRLSRGRCGLWPSIVPLPVVRGYRPLISLIAGDPAA